MPRPEDVVALLAARGVTVATAESVTGGAVCAALVSVPGASAVVRGGIVAYTAELKERLLGVDPELIHRAGLVSDAVAEAMAQGAREATGATVAVATTGVAGPDAHDGAPPGRVHIAVAGPAGRRSARHDLVGDRDEVRRGAVDLALAALLDAVSTDVTVL